MSNERDSGTPGDGLTIADLETAYDILANAIDEAGDRAELFLVKLALVNANALGSAETFQNHVHEALKDL